MRDHCLLQISSTRAPIPYVLGITSCAVGAGCSTMANELATALARESGLRTVLVDASTEAVAPSCYAVNAQGQFEQLDVLAQAAATEKAAAVPDYTGRNQVFATMINFLREGTFQVVIVDLPPVTESGLTRRVAWLHNGMLMVVPSEKISRSVAGIVQKWLAVSECHIFGCILNKRRKYVPDWICQKL